MFKLGRVKFRIRDIKFDERNFLKPELLTEEDEYIRYLDHYSKDKLLSN